MLMMQEALEQRLSANGFNSPESRAVATVLAENHSFNDKSGLSVEQVSERAGVKLDDVTRLLGKMEQEAWVVALRDDQGQIVGFRLSHWSAFTLAAESAHSAAVETRSGYTIGGTSRSSAGQLRDEREANAKATEAYAMLKAVLGGGRIVQALSDTALGRLADNKPLDPCDERNWSSSDAAAQAVLRRYGIIQLPTSRLTLQAVRALVSGQRQIDEEVGLTWTTVEPAAALGERLRAAHRELPVDIEHPDAWAYPGDKRRVVAKRVGIEDFRADELSRWVLANPDNFDAGETRCWRIGSASWLECVDEQLGPLTGRVDRPVGVFVTPARTDGAWALSPALSLNMIRLVAELGGTIDRDLTSFSLPGHQVPAFINRINIDVLHVGERTMLQSRKQLLEEVNKVLDGYGVTLAAVNPDDKRDAWGRLSINRWRNDSELEVRVVTFGGKTMEKRRLGAAPGSHKDGGVSLSAAMDLGEAVQTAAERGLPLLLSTEAAGHLAGQIRVGRMKGRPGQLTITTSDGISAQTRKLVAEQAIAELRKLRTQQMPVRLDAGAKQIVQMTLAKPLADDPVLLGRQAEIAAIKVVGSGVDASQVGTGKTVTTGRCIYHRAASTARFRAVVSADGRLLEQWRSELLDGAPGRGMPPLAPNVEVLIVDERTSPAAQLRAWDRQLGDRAGLVLVPDNILDRYPSEMCSLRWHLWVGDEALRYVNPATEAHRSAREFRLRAVADCWLLTATPKGKDSGHLDVLVGLAVGDEAMIDEKLNTREAGNLVHEDNAHRVRVNFGPTLVRVTRPDMAAWMPDVRPAEPLIVTPDCYLQDLLDAIREGGRNAYLALLKAIKRVKALEESTGKNTDLYRAALREVSTQQAFVLANVNVFVDASIDPETLLHSQSTLAQALVAQGVVQPAVTGGGDGLPTLRGIVAQTLARVSDQEQVLVFAERTRCLHQLAKTIRDRHGVEARVGDGKLTKPEFDELKARYITGEFPILMLSPVGNSGHNLQNASQICHYDLPWVQTGLEQRVGRSGRLGNTRGYVGTTIPYIKGGGIEHIVKVLADRSAEHHQLLDSFEGVQASESTIATQLGAITSQVADNKDAAGYGGDAARLRVAAAVFGSTS